MPADSCNESAAQSMVTETVMSSADSIIDSLSVVCDCWFGGGLPREVFVFLTCRAEGLLATFLGAAPYVCPESAQDLPETNLSECFSDSDFCGSRWSAEQSALRKP
jgi:hypothetical protein